MFVGTLGYAAFVIALYYFSRGACSGDTVVLAAALNGICVRK